MKTIALIGTFDTKGEEYLYVKNKIEKIKVKSKDREEVRFALYKDTFKMERQFIPRSLDLTEKQLLELIRKAIEGKVFSDEFVKLLRDELNK